MASRKTYPCFACEKAGHDNVQVYLDGKDDQGRTKYLNEDGTRHTHQDSSATTTQQTQPTEQEQQPSLAQIVQILQGLESKIDRLTKLIYAQSNRHDDDDQNPHTLLDNR